MAIEPPGTPQRPESPSSLFAAQSNGAGARDDTRGTASGGGLRLWPRSLRWRLILTNALLLGLTMLALALTLNAVIARTLYTTEFGFFQNEAVAAVNVAQLRLDALTLGRAPNCIDAIPYEDAFKQAITDPITESHPGSVQGVYLLDGTGAVLAPLSAQSDASSARYLSRPRLARLATRASAVFNVAPPNGQQLLASDGYFVNNRAQPYGVELIAVRYYTSSACVKSTHAALGYVEIVTTFTRTRQALAALRLTLYGLMGLVFALGILIGSPLLSVALLPLSRVTQAARKVAAGDLTQRVRLRHTQDEVGQLGATFDDMVARIETAFGVRRRSEERMRQFIADASHELRTPLTSIRGYTDVLLRGAKDDPETTERVLLATRREAERMSRLVNDLLTLARLDTGRPLETQPIDLLSLVGDCVDQARILAGQREVIMRSDGNGRLMVRGDEDRLKQVILVLLDNALKYGRQAPDGWARVHVSRQRGEAIVSVEDNGPGIAPDDLAHIFERFYRAERAARNRRLSGSPAPATPQPTDGASAAEGSGLGLAIAQAIAEAHGGSLTAQSTLGVGSIFTLKLPLAPVEPGATTTRLRRPSA